MKLILFCKAFKSKGPEELVALGHELGIAGFDLCVRPGYPIHAGNAGQRLSEAVRRLRREGLDVPMVTGNFDLLTADHPDAAPLVAAMDQADVRLLKLGYFKFDPWKQDYWQEADRIRRAFEGWQELGRKHNVRICYHTHSRRLMGLNAAALMHLLRGFEPKYLGAYLDPGHFVIDGEEFAVALAMTRAYLSIVALKDVFLAREEVNGHGRKKAHFVRAGEGMVDWTTVFADLARVPFTGPLSMHCEFECPPEQFVSQVKSEVAFFQRRLKEAAGAGASASTP